MSIAGVPPWTDGMNDSWFGCALKLHLLSRVQRPAFLSEGELSQQDTIIYHIYLYSLLQCMCVKHMHIHA